MIDELEKSVDSASSRECRWCGEKYNFKEREEAVRKQNAERGVTAPDHATEYCKNECWFEADKTGSTKHAGE